MDVYNLLDLGDNLCFVTLYIEVNFDASPETLTEHFSVCTQVDDPSIAK